MKWFYSIVALFLILQSCDNSNESIDPGKFQFTFSPSIVSKDGGRTQSNFDNVHSLRLTVKESNGTHVLNMQEVELIKFGNALISEPVELTAGDYMVTDFLLIDAGGAVIFATPKKDSPLASAVDQALPLYFSVSEDAVENLEISVIDVNNRAPEAFGYVSFNIGEVLAFPVSAFIADESGNQLTSAIAKIYDGDTTLVKTIPLSAKVNYVSFSGDASKKYTLKVSKSSYATYSKDFVYDSLLDELDGLPLKATLIPAITITTTVPSFTMTVEGASSLTINWGDGHIETGPGGKYVHVYSDDYYNEVTRHIEVTGDLENVTEFMAYYGMNMDSLSVVHLPNLEDIRIGIGRGPEVVDLTHNPKLNYVDVTELPEMKELLLPADHRIQFITISGVNQLTVAKVDSLIDDIHAKAVQYNLRPGVFDFYANWRSGGGDGSLIGPPSPAQINKLKDLRDNYSWNLRPAIP